MTLGEHEDIVGAWASSYPRYGTRLITVCIRNAWDGSHRVESLQDEDQNAQLRTLFPLLAQASGELLAWLGAMEADGTIRRVKAARRKARRRRNRNE